MAKTWEREGKVGMSRLVSEELIRHWERTRDATMLVTMGASTLVIQREVWWSSKAFMVYVKANIEDSR